MESTIYGLNYDYTYQNGQSIVFNKRNGQKLTGDDLISVQLKMIQSNRIPHMLELTVENFDLTTRLHYDLTSKRKMISYFRDNSTTMNDYYQLFLAIISTLEESGSYMLDQRNFLLHTDFIFVGENASDVYLTYLPINAISKESAVTDDLKALLTDVAGEVEGLQGNEFKSILNYIKNSSFSLVGLKKLLLELISLRSNVNQPRENPTSYDPISVNQNIGTPQPVNSQTERSRPVPQQQQTQTMEATSSKKQKVKKQLPKLSSRAKVYMFTGSLLTLALTWKLYDISTTSTTLIICSALSLLIVAGVFVFWKIWRPGVSKVETEAQTKENHDSKQTNNNQQQPNPAANQQSNQNVSFQTQYQFYNRGVANASFEAKNSVAATAMDTTLLTQNNEDTVLLEDESDLVMNNDLQEEVMPKLMRVTEDNQEETISINRANFVIGRNAEAVNYVEEAVGVSRVHAEIVKIDAKSYGVKDLGSKNGSKLNGNTMVPYKIYALNENDEFTLGKANYTFTWGNSQ
ncbi:DUF6382 domain-containing protein [Virgibacillus ndiopensis]|uniref:DUF6382 domain-containing protein n=1 Tax=Virgibacillus ndiopensis TaxID=2004408 RepID=UPI000C08B689|nr:DUF6382 domain-containing protein [Virgibacillus ndiopensis]